MRKLGKLGESTFQSLCAAAGITCNKSHLDDETGWDFFIEFPFDFSLPVPIDMQPVPLACLVQLKSTDKRKKTVQIKLSNILRLIKTSTPAFIVVFDFDSKSEPRCANVVHIDRSLIELGLKKIRELEASGERRINRHKIAIPLNDDNDVEPVEAKSLLKTIEKCVPRPFEEYPQWKRAIVEKIGFNETTAHGRLIFGPTKHDFMSEFVDVMLGLRPEINVSSFSMTSVRFGIEIEHPTLQSGKLTVTPNPVSSCRVIFKAGDAEISLDGKIFIPGIPNLPEHYRKIKIETEILMLVIGFGDQKIVEFKLNPRSDHPTVLKEIFKFFKIMRALHGEAVELAVYANHQNLFDGKLNSLEKKDVRNWGIPAKVTANLMNLVGEQATSFHASINEILKNLEELNNFIQSSTDGTGTMSVCLQPSRPFDWPAIIGKRIGCIIPVFFNLQDRHLISIVLQDGTITSTTPQVDGNIQLEISIASRSTLEHFDFIGTGEMLDREIAIRFEKLEHLKEKDDFAAFFIVPNPSRLTNKYI